MIQDLLDNGMWGGKIKVVQTGSSSVVEAAGNPFTSIFQTLLEAL